MRVCLGSVFNLLNDDFPILSHNLFYALELCLLYVGVFILDEKVVHFVLLFVKENLRLCLRTLILVCTLIFLFLLLNRNFTQILLLLLNLWQTKLSSSN